MRNLIIKITLLITFILILFSCTNEYDEATEDEKIKIKEYIHNQNFDTIYNSESGLYYYEFETGTGEQVQANEFISITINGTTIDQDFDPEYADSNVTLIVDNNPMIEGINEGVQLMREGSKGRFIVPFKLAYYTPNAISAIYDTYVFDVTVNEIIEDVKAWEIDRIYQYLAENYDSSQTIKMDSTTGFCYIPIEKGQGDSAQYGQRASLYYTGSLLDGTLFNNTYEERQFTSDIDTSSNSGLIKGFAKGITMMKEGEEATIIIPYSLGHGSDYIGTVIPSYASLVFWVKLVDVY